MTFPLHKKGDTRECKNYCGTSLLSIIGKTFMKIIQSCLQKHHEQSSREEQAGFWPGQECCNQIVFRQLIEQRFWCGQRTVIVFINFKSAFKCIDRATLWRTLEAKHLQEDHYPPQISLPRLNQPCATTFAPSLPFLYGSETWVILKHKINNLKAFKCAVCVRFSVSLCNV